MLSKKVLETAPAHRCLFEAAEYERAGLVGLCNQSRDDATRIDSKCRCQDFLQALHLVIASQPSDACSQDLTFDVQILRIYRSHGANMQAMLQQFMSVLWSYDWNHGKELELEL